MKTMNMISRRNFLKAALGAAAVSAFSLTGCGGSASSAASGTASSAAASSAAASAEAGQTFKVGIVNYVDHASLNQIVASVESRLDEVGKEKGVTFPAAEKTEGYCEAIEIPGHPFYLGVIYHPEYLSRPDRPHPLFYGFVKAAVEKEEEK